MVDITDSIFTLNPNDPSDDGKPKKRGVRAIFLDKLELELEKMLYAVQDLQVKDRFSNKSLICGHNIKGERRLEWLDVW